MSGCESAQESSPKLRLSIALCQEFTDIVAFCKAPSNARGSLDDLSAAGGEPFHPMNELRRWGDELEANQVRRWTVFAEMLFEAADLRADDERFATPHQAHRLPRRGRHRYGRFDQQPSRTDVEHTGGLAPFKACPQRSDDFQALVCATVAES